MIKHIARLNAEVILIGSRQVLEVTAHLVEEFETDFSNKSIFLKKLFFRFLDMLG